MKNMLCCGRVMRCVLFWSWVELGCKRGRAKRDGRVANVAVLPVPVRRDNNYHQHYCQAAECK